MLPLAGISYLSTVKATGSPALARGLAAGPGREEGRGREAWPPPRTSPSRGDEPTVDYSYDQRDEGAGSLARGARVHHAQFGEGTVLACEGTGTDRKATVRFAIGDKRVLVRFLTLG